MNIEPSKLGEMNHNQESLHKNTSNTYTHEIEVVKKLHYILNKVAQGNKHKMKDTNIPVDVYFHLKYRQKLENIIKDTNDSESIKNDKIATIIQKGSDLVAKALKGDYQNNIQSHKKKSFVSKILQYFAASKNKGITKDRETKEYLKQIIDSGVGKIMQEMRNHILELANPSTQNTLGIHNDIRRIHAIEIGNIDIDPISIDQTMFTIIQKQESILRNLIDTTIKSCKDGTLVHDDKVQHFSNKQINLIERYTTQIINMTFRDYKKSIEEIKDANKKRLKDFATADAKNILDNTLVTMHNGVANHTKINHGEIDAIEKKLKSGLEAMKEHHVHEIQIMHALYTGEYQQDTYNAFSMLQEGVPDINSIGPISRNELEIFFITNMKNSIDGLFSIVDTAYDTIIHNAIVEFRKHVSGLHNNTQDTIKKNKDKASVEVTKYGSSIGGNHRQISLAVQKSDINTLIDNTSSRINRLVNFHQTNLLTQEILNSNILHNKGIAGVGYTLQVNKGSSQYERSCGISRIEIDGIKSHLKHCELGSYYFILSDESIHGFRITNLETIFTLTDADITEDKK